MNKEGIRGLWIDEDLQANVVYQDTIEKLPFKPFAWFSHDVLGYHADVQELQGEGQLTHLAEFNTEVDFKEAVKQEISESVRGLENQMMLKEGIRYFSDMHFKDLKRCQLDIETACSAEGGFSTPTRKDDRVLAIGLKMDDIYHYLLLKDNTDAAEVQLLQELNEILIDWDPDVIEGHNIFSFDFYYLQQRCKRHKVPCKWGRQGAEAVFRKSRFKVAERWVDFLRCDIPGRTVFDTYLMIQQYDVVKRELDSYGLKQVALALGITKEEDRTYLKAQDIQEAFYTDRETFLAYLKDDLRETASLADFLLPTYFAQAESFPMTLQEICLRGTGTKVDTLFLEKYYHAKQSLPKISEGYMFAGGFTKSFEVGVFQHVLHFDVASLYPSLLLFLGENPKGDHLGCFIPMLQKLREYRLQFKEKARTEQDPILKREYEARQNAFKILINSFYGYLGFSGARFGDYKLAEKLTQLGRDLLIELIYKFESLNCKILEADTDGIYLASDVFFEQPEVLLKLVSEVMPKGVELEYDGKYEAMFSYKAKNYALREGENIIIRGSAFRSRGIEPFLRDLTETLIREKLGFKGYSVEEKIMHYQAIINEKICPIDQLAKSERLSQNPEAYKKAVEGSKKPRRAALEVALSMVPIPKMGEKVTYFISKGPKARMPDWQVARALTLFDPVTLSYDERYYLRKLEDWQKRYSEVL